MTLEGEKGRLVLGLEDAEDWLLLEDILDVGERDDGGLARELGASMDQDELWTEWVVPELEKHFDQQRAAIRQAIAEGGGAPGEIVISEKEAADWYGAVNQAALANQARAGRLKTTFERAMLEAKGRLFSSLLSALLDCFEIV